MIFFTTARSSAVDCSCCDVGAVINKKLYHRHLLHIVNGERLIRSVV